MKNTFNLNRFVKLFSKHTVDHYKTYLLAILVLLGMLTVILGYFAHMKGGSLTHNIQYGLFAVTFVLSGTVFTSTVFSDFGDKKKSISMLMLPASGLEKYLVAWIYSFIIFQLVFLGCFYTVDYLILVMGSQPDKSFKSLMNTFSGEEQRNLIFVTFGILHSAAFFGSIFFKKMHFIKSAVVVFVFTLFLLFMNGTIAGLLIDTNIVQASVFEDLWIREADINYSIAPLPSVKLITVCLSCALCLVLWTGAYFKLKEKEV